MGEQKKPKRETNQVDKGGKVKDSAPKSSKSTENPKEDNGTVEIKVSKESSQENTDAENKTCGKIIFFEVKDIPCFGEKANGTIDSRNVCKKTFTEEEVKDIIAFTIDKTVERIITLSNESKIKEEQAQVQAKQEKIQRIAKKLADIVANVILVVIGGALLSVSFFVLSKLFKVIF